VPIDFGIIIIGRRLDVADLEPLPLDLRELHWLVSGSKDPDSVSLDLGLVIGGIDGLGGHGVPRDLAFGSIAFRGIVFCEGTGDLESVAFDFG